MHPVGSLSYNLSLSNLFNPWFRSVWNLGVRFFSEKRESWSRTQLNFGTQMFVCFCETFHWSQSEVPLQLWLMLYAWQTEQLLEIWTCFFDLKQRRQSNSENYWPTVIAHYLFMRIKIFDHELHKAEWRFVMRKWKGTERIGSGIRLISQELETYSISGSCVSAREDES